MRIWRPALPLVVGLVMLTPLGIAWAQTPAATPAPAPAIILFQSNYRVLVMLTIGDHPPMPAVFDTGTNGNVIDIEVAARLGL